MGHECFMSSNAVSHPQIGVNMAVQTENVSEEVVQPPEEQSAQSLNTQETSNEPVEESSKEHNFKQLREVNKQLEERLRKSEETIETIVGNNSQQQIPAPPQEEELGAEDLAEGRHLKKLEAKFEKLLYQKEMEAIPSRLKAKFEDFDEVVTKENLEKLKKTEPELFQTINSGDNFYATGVSAYKTLKSLGYAQDQEDIMKQKDHVHANHKKPLSAQAIKGQGALHEANIFANGLTPELKKQLQKEMVEAAKAR